MTYGMCGSVVLFLVAYYFISTEKIPNSITAIFGMVAAMLFGLISVEDAMKAIDLNVIFLIVGMMTCVAILSDTGFFEWIAIWMVKKAKGNATVIFVALLLLTMILSAFLDNVTTIILIAPLSIIVAQILELPVQPILIFESLASNIGGTATLIGDPPNIVIGSQAKLSFNDFLFHLSPCVMIIAVVFIATTWLMLRRRLVVSDGIKAKIADFCPERAILNRGVMYRSLFIFGLMILCFVLHSVIHLEVGSIAFVGMGAMIVLCRSKTEHAYKAVEWDAVFFFMGLFVIVGAMETNGVIKLLADKTMALCKGDMLLTCMAVLWGSAVVSAFLNNIPFIVVMIPMIQQIMQEMHISHEGPHPLYWALALGVCLGGNGTLIGASANILAGNIGNKNGFPISFWNFTKYGFPLMIQSIIIASLYILIRYFHMGAG